jgi:CRISPR-associated protein Cmr1
MEIDISRLKGISRARYELEVVTPLFMGGADPKFAEIRAQSIKGLLRFWWRAHQKETDIKKLREKENRIFGSTDGKSRFSISVECGDKPQMSNLNKGATFAVEGRGGNLGILDYFHLAFASGTMS